MDYPLIKAGAESGAIVVWANYYQFGPGEVVTNRQVESRAFVWANSGAGAIEIGGRMVELTTSTYAFLPWCHDITYRADMHDPFMAAAIHIVPWHDPTVPVERYAAHGRRDHLAGVPYRRDQDWADLRGVVQGTAPSGGRLFGTARLTLDHVQHGCPDTASLRALATVLLTELRAAQRDGGTPVAGSPPKLLRMQRYILGHLHGAVTIDQVAAAGGVSQSSAARLFRQHAGTSIGQWISTARMTMARDLLRTTNGSVAEVARAVGIADPAYFSRLFRRLNGVPPSTYAEQSRLI